MARPRFAVATASWCVWKVTIGTAGIPPHITGGTVSATGGASRCQIPKPPPEPEPDLEEVCRTDGGGIDMCCVCCDPRGRNQSICTQNPQIAEQCRFRPEGCGPPKPVDGECGSSQDTCAVGTYQDGIDSDTHYYWECLGRHGGRSAYCDEPKSSDPGSAFDGRWTLSSIITQHCSQVEGEGELRVHRGRLSGWFQQNETVRTGEGTYRRNVLQQNRRIGL